MANQKELEILDVGQELIQTRGYAGFSYRDIADRVGIKSATIHYYFPTKADLAEAVTGRYRESFAGALAAIDAQPDLTSIERLRRYAGIFQATLRSDRVCLCGMLASGVETVPEATKISIQQFFADQHAWVTRTLSTGPKDESARTPRDIERWSLAFVSALEGAMLIARSLGDPGHLDQVIEQLLEDLSATPDD